MSIYQCTFKITYWTIFRGESLGISSKYFALMLFILDVYQTTNVVNRRLALLGVSRLFCLEKLTLIFVERGVGTN